MKGVLALAIAIAFLSTGEVHAYSGYHACAVGDDYPSGHTHPDLVQWTPNGTQILFDMHMRLYLAEVDGTRVEWVADGASDLFPRDSAWVPSSRMTADISPDGLQGSLRDL